MAYFMLYFNWSWNFFIGFELHKSTWEMKIPGSLLELISFFWATKKFTVFPTLFQFKQPTWNFSRNINQSSSMAICELATLKPAAIRFEWTKYDFVSRLISFYHTLWRQLKSVFKQWVVQISRTFFSFLIFWPIKKSNVVWLSSVRIRYCLVVWRTKRHPVVVNVPPPAKS